MAEQEGHRRLLGRVCATEKGCKQEESIEVVYKRLNWSHMLKKASAHCANMKVLQLVWVGPGTNTSYISVVTTEQKRHWTRKQGLPFSLWPV